jgi:hypothetical protein
VLDYGILNFGFYQPFKAEFPPVSNIILAQVTAAWGGTIGNDDSAFSTIRFDDFVVTFSGIFI